MVQTLFFDLDDTLLWDEKSIQVALSKTCEMAADEFEVNHEQLEGAVRKVARTLYATYKIYPFTQMIGINPFEGLWGTFDDEGEQFQKMKTTIPNYQREVWTQGLSELGIENQFAGEQLAQSFIQNRIEHPFLYEETYDVLNTLQNQYELVLITNGAPSLQRKKLEMTPELKPYFEHIVISGEFGVGKPDVRIFEHALNLCHIDANEALMVGDNELTDILGANRAGIPSVWINHHNKKVTKAKPTYEINKLKQLLTILNK